MAHTSLSRKLFSSPYPYHDVQGDMRDLLSHGAFWWAIFGSMGITLLAYTGLISMSWGALLPSLLIMVPFRFLSRLSGVFIQRFFLPFSIVDEQSSYLGQIQINIQKAMTICMLFLLYTLSDELLPLWEGLIGMAFAQELCDLAASWFVPLSMSLKKRSLYHAGLKSAIIATVLFSFLFLLNPITLPVHSYSSSLMLYFLSNMTTTIGHFTLQFLCNRIKDFRAHFFEQDSVFSLEAHLVKNQKNDVPTITMSSRRKFPLSPEKDSTDSVTKSSL